MIEACFLKISICQNYGRLSINSREQILERLSCEPEVLNRKNKTRAQCKLMLHRSMGRYVQQPKSGKLKIEKAKVARDFP